MSSPAALPLLAGLGPQEVVLILLVVVLLFGAKKLPELARGSGRALRIFKAETKGLLEDDDDVPASQKTEAQLKLDAQRRAEAAERLDPATETPVERVRPVEVEHARPVEVEHPRPDVER